MRTRKDMLDFPYMNSFEQQQQEANGYKIGLLTTCSLQTKSNVVVLQ